MNSNQKLESLSLMAQQKGLTVAPVKGYECRLHFESAAVDLSSLEDLEYILVNDLKPKFNLNQAVQWTAKFETSEVFEKPVSGTVNQICFNGRFKYHCKTDYKPSYKQGDPYEKMVSPKERWIKEEALS